MALVVPVLAAVTACGAQGDSVASAPRAEPFAVHCDGASAAFDREYLAESADAAVREEAPDLLGLPADELTWVRGGPAPHGPSILFNARRDGELVGVFAVVDAPGASGVEHYTACGRSTLPFVEQVTPPPASSPAPTAGPAGDAATWDTDPTAPPVATDRSFTALVERLGCNGGVTGDVLSPEVVESADRVVITFTVRAKEPGAASCPSNDRVPTRVTLSTPVGDRALVDGSGVGGGERWPS